MDSARLQITNLAHLIAKSGGEEEKKIGVIIAASVIAQHVGLMDELYVAAVRVCEAVGRIVDKHDKGVA